MELIYNNDRFEFLCSKIERQVPKEAGFTFDWNNNVWHTKNPHAAKRVEHYAQSTQVKDLIAQLLCTSKPILSFNPNTKQFIWKSSIEFKDVPKTANFFYNFEDQTWYTESWEKAALLVEQYGDALAKCEVEDQRDFQKRTLNDSRACSADIDIPVPKGLEYLPFQKAGIKFMVQRDNTLLSDSMGLGKSIQGAGLLNSMVSQNPKLRILIVCPASLKLNWKRELEKWLIKPLSISVLNSKDSFCNSDIVILNYDILKKFKTEINAITWDVLIGDEIHMLKSSKSQRSQMVFGKTEKGSRTFVIEPIKAHKKILMTGTPIPNRPKELFPILNYLDPANWNSFWNFAKRYCNGFQDRFGFNAEGASNLEEMQDRMRSSVMIRRLKEDVLKELPPKIQQVIVLPQGKASKLIQRELDSEAKYQETRARLKADLEATKTRSEEEYQNTLNKLRESNSVHIGEMARMAHELAVIKAPLVIEYLSEMLENDSDHKVVLFAHHKDVIQMFMEAFGDKAVCVSGDVSLANRQVAVDRFQNDPSVQVFVGNIKAAGVGLTLTASSHVVFAEMDWVPGNMLQAEDRCSRIGQINPVLVQKLVFDESLDIRKLNVLEEKMLVQNSALDNQTDFVPEEVFIPEIKINLEPVFLDLEVREQNIQKEQSYLGRIKQIEEQKQKKAAKMKTLEDLAETLTPSQIALIHQGLKEIAGVCDGAQELDGAGFNKLDAQMGRALAYADVLSPLDAAIGFTLVRKYKRQVSVRV